MTLRQVLGIIGHRWILVLLTTILIGGATAAYALLTPQVYESSTTLRYSEAAATTLEGPGGYQGMELDLDTFFVTSEEVLEGAAAETGDSVAELQESTSVALLEGVRTQRLEITSEAESPEQAQARANAVGEAYTSHLQSQVDASLAELEADLEEADVVREEAIEAVGEDPEDTFVQDQLGVALSEHAELASQIDAIENAGPPVTTLQTASPGGRVGTDLPLLIVIGIISGLIAGAGVALIRDLFDDRMRTALAMQEIAEQPLLAEIPLVEKRGADDLSLPLAGIAPTPFNESIRNLRTSLQVSYSEQHAVIAITSPMPADGKTFLTANLAVSVARSGRSVVIVSGDLRRPRVESYFGEQTEKEGLSEALRSDAATEQIREFLLPTQFDGLRLLPAGVARSQPADLLAGDSLPRVIERLRELADVILIDTPPGMVIADATLLGAQADGVVVVSSVKSTSKRNLLSTLETLESSGCSVAGIVANRSKRRTMPRSYDSYLETASDVDAKS
ncbi:polysaccharide biosynthesis tyrosine autokinase [Nesterenkonia salmonea]|uniref:Polysaccharide biosynthesis tyrosine autokinase n=1 Tax=Nesterenkonia salmonea TaxID=1804987 RepID=A0A5R9BAL7_9MICC|nr:polysaccharide biosynthesis tyrosine autokinase [Nesterenkonia salmonea]TLP97031.1 polysaccharide biosynthesis tyrosine autokinase [Nesterenkonia salmonea]